MKPKVLHLFAHARDCQNWQIEDTEGNIILEHDGYALDTCFSRNNGDDINITIDIETGKILGWDPDMINRLVEGVR